MNIDVTWCEFGIFQPPRGFYYFIIWRISSIKDAGSPAYPSPDLNKANKLRSYWGSSSIEIPRNVGVFSKDYFWFRLAETTFVDYVV